MNSQITFYFKPTFPMTCERSISIVGNIKELGSWADFKKHPLENDRVSPENYISKCALLLPIYTPFQYKMVVVEQDQIIHWENLPFNTNRSYTIQAFSITLKGNEGELPIKEIPFIISTPLEVEEELLLDKAGVIKKNSRKKKFEDAVFSQKEISSDSLEERDKRRNRNSNGSLHDLERHLKNFNKNQKINEKFVSDTSNSYRRKRKKGSRRASDTSISSLRVSSRQSSRKELSAYKEHKDIKDEEEKAVKRIGLQEMYREMMENTPNRLRGFNVLRSQNDIVYQITEDYIVNLNYEEVVYIIMSYLPLSVSYDPKEKKWKVDMIPLPFEILKYIPHFFSQARSQYKKMIWVGMLYDDVPLNEQEYLKKYLFDNYRCLVAFPSPKVHFNYITYCYEYLDLILCNSFNLNNVSFDLLENFNTGYRDFRTVNEIMADLVSEKSKENALVFVLDYHLLLVNFYLVKKIVKPSILFYYSMSFPCFENFQLLQFNEEFLSSFLLGSIICFDDFSHARQFLSILANVMGLKFEAIRGDIMIRYMGRQIKIKVNSIGLDTTYLEVIKRSNEFVEVNKSLAEKYKGKNVIFNIDPLNKIAFLDVKMKLLTKIFEDCPHLKANTVFIQILNPTYWDLKILQDGIETHKNYLRQYLDTLRTLKKNLAPIAEIIVNLDEKYCEDKKLSEFFNGFTIKKLKSFEIHGLMSVAKLFLKCSVKNENSIELLEFLFLNDTDGQILYSDLMSLNPLFNKINKFNPFSYEEFKEKFLNIFDPLDKTLEKNVLSSLESNASLLKKYTVVTWLESLLYDLKKSILFAKHANLTKVEKLTSYHSVTYFKLATNEFFKYLNFTETLKNYSNSYNRIIIFDYEGTLVNSDQYTDVLIEYPNAQVENNLILKPSDSILEALKLLSNDPWNSVYLITGKSPKELGPWITDIRNLNIFCEYGYLIRLKRSGSNWIRLYESNDWRWKSRGMEIMKQYANNIQSSWIYEKESGIVWNHGEVNEELGWKQADLLMKQLKSDLINFKEIDIIKGRYYVEIRPYGINKVRFFLSLLKGF